MRCRTGALGAVTRSFGTRVGRCPCHNRAGFWSPRHSFHVTPALLGSVLCSFSPIFHYEVHCAASAFNDLNLLRSQGPPREQVARLCAQRISLMCAACFVNVFDTSHCVSIYFSGGIDKVFIRLDFNWLMRCGPNVIN